MPKKLIQFKVNFKFLLISELSLSVSIFYRFFSVISCSFRPDGHLAAKHDFRISSRSLQYFDVLKSSSKKFEVFYIQSVELEKKLPTEFESS